MTAAYTFDVFSGLDGYGSAGGSWTGYRGKQGPELLDHRLALYGEEQQMVFGANTYRAFATRSQSPLTGVQHATTSSGDHSRRMNAPAPPPTTRSA
ncbi:hypothetical protein GCM10022252_01110 [Streptosporangium oxazolinicum]|uniref:Uncharacterized protein n=1 Tax=Streptosporangium oxazolinicum TaxID=909287 RepID=A0ABP8A7R1_9ACTN